LANLGGRSKFLEIFSKAWFTTPTIGSIELGAEGKLSDNKRHLDKFLVPIGDMGMTVYQVNKKGVAKIRTTLNAKLGPGY
jgi:hypothetical protein